MRWDPAQENGTLLGKVVKAAFLKLQDPGACENIHLSASLYLSSFSYLSVMELVKTLRDSAIKNFRSKALSEEESLVKIYYVFWEV